MNLGCMNIDDYINRRTCCRRYKGNRNSISVINTELLLRFLESDDFLNCFYVKDGKIRGARDWNKMLGYFINEKVVENELHNNN